MNPFEKLLSIFLLIGIAFITLTLTGHTYDWVHGPKKTYCGTIVDKGIEINGKESNYTITFYCPEIKRKILVPVSGNDYANANIKEKGCADLREYQTR